MSDDLSDYGRLNEHRKLLADALKASTDEGEQKRLQTLITTIDNLKRDPDDKVILKQFALNVMDLERYRASKRGG